MHQMRSLQEFKHNFSCCNKTTKGDGTSLIGAQQRGTLIISNFSSKTEPTLHDLAEMRDLNHAKLNQDIKNREVIWTNAFFRHTITDGQVMLKQCYESTTTFFRIQQAFQVVLRSRP